MESNIYLSVDLDYWCLEETNDAMDKFLNKLLSQRKKIYIVHSHEKLLNDINTSQCNTLINIDFHSDIADAVYKFNKKRPYNYDNNYPLTLNEGTWVNFVKFQQDGEFIWIYPNAVECVNKYKGLCHSWEDGNILKNDPFTNATSNWKSIKRHEGIGDLDFSNIDKIGLCTSISWLNKIQLSSAVLQQIFTVDNKDELYKELIQHFKFYF